MDFGTLLFRAIFGSVLFQFLVELGRFKLRGRGPSDVGPLELFGYTVLLAAAVWSPDLSKTPESGVLLRGGSLGVQPVVIKKENPAFRLRRANGTLARVNLERLKAEFVKRPTHKIRKSSDKQGRDMTVDEIEKELLAIFGDCEIFLEQGPRLRFTPETVGQLTYISDLILEDGVDLVESRYFRTQPGREGYIMYSTASGDFVEAADSRMGVWNDILPYMEDDLNVKCGNDLYDDITLRDIFVMIDYEIARAYYEIFDSKTNKYKFLSPDLFRQLLSSSKRLQVAWEDQWVTVSEDFFKFMQNRIEQAEAGNKHLSSVPKSLHQFAAPGFEPLKLDRDGLFLVSKRMEQIERERPVFKFSFFYIPGYCLKGSTEQGARCDPEANRKGLKFSIRGITDYEQELDEIQPANPELEMMANDLERNYSSKPEYVAVKGKLTRFNIPLLDRDEEFMTNQYIYRGKYLQMYEEHRTLLGWLKKSLDVAKSIDFDNKMKDWIEQASSLSSMVRRDLFENYLSKRRMARVMLSCRPSDSPPAGILTTITVCLNREYKPVDCGRVGSCGAYGFLWASSPEFEAHQSLN
ncbi:uncharacterized protein LOC100906921 [Galendromus occidentalis]|uniref:Uncharacterized protein LOC100906921 n=1 Tax=Galendromus occidentalis TaxID=34638 RepID=A0AAJ6QPZ2_9ACAR|nr:uncharacterized protein LOC100906921 [Galendromus occidentalis]